MRETATPAALADAMLARVEARMRARHGAVVVGGELLDARDVEPGAVEAWLVRPEALDERLRCDRADPVFPVRLRLSSAGVGPVGWLLLGPCPDGSFYGRNERRAARDRRVRRPRAGDRDRREAERRAGEDALHRDVSDLWRLVATMGERLGLGSAMVSGLK